MLPDRIYLYVSIIASAIVVVFLIYKNYAKKKKRERRIYEENLKNITPKVTKLEGILFSELWEKYLNHRKYLKWKEQLEHIYKEIKPFAKDLKESSPLLFGILFDKEFVKEHNKKIVARDKELYRSFFVDLDHHGYGLTDKQLDAVFSEEDATLVNAGAGTGKTKVIESKLLYLHTKKWIPLEDMLVVTYSKKSQQDMMDRICNTLDLAQVQHDKEVLSKTIATFHAFWKQVVDENTSVKHKDWEKRIGIGTYGKRVIDEKEHKELLSLVFKNLSEKTWNKTNIRNYLLYYSVPQVEVTKFKNLSEYYENITKTYISLIQDWKFSVAVKSYGELLIANFCVAHGINVVYEPKGHYYTDEEGNKKDYKPDFYLPDHWVYIEYFGVDKDGGTAPYVIADNYSLRMAQKIADHKLSDNKLIDLRYADLQEGVDSFINKLKQELENNEVEYDEELNYDHLLEHKQLNGSFTGMARLLNTFLSLYKESDATIDSLYQKIANFDKLNTRRSQLFLLLFEKYLEEYNRLMEEWGYIDFGDMILEAIHLLESGLVKRDFKYILVDEFQDISLARANLIKTLIKDNTRLFTVGDDRQSIYQFAWSNTNIFLDFDNYFWYTEHITLDQTFRFNQWISDVSGEFVMKNPNQTTKQLKALDPQREERIAIYQQNEDRLIKKEDQVYYQILGDIIREKRAKLGIENGEDIEISILYLTRYFQWRYKSYYDLSFLEYLSKYFWLAYSEKESCWMAETKSWGNNIRLKVESMTIHKSKWLEADFVVIEHVNQGGLYDFPSKFEDDPLLELINEKEKGMYAYAEERRLFYVAITRWKIKSYLIYNKEWDSLFLRDLAAINDDIVKIVSNGSQKTNKLEGGVSWPRCLDCGWRIIPSAYGSKNSRFSEYYCSSYFYGCEATYILYRNQLHKIPNCPNFSCGLPMKLRENKRSKYLFWGCSNYPKCDGTRKFDLENPPFYSSFKKR